MEPLLIVGHTTPDATTVWLRGGVGHRSVEVELRRRDGRDGGGGRRQTRALRKSADFTTTVPFTDLDPDTPYAVIARFRRARRVSEVTGTVRTFPPEDVEFPFSFFLGSCNLSTVSLTHLGGLAAAGFGMLATRASLRRPPSQRAWDLRRVVRAAFARILPHGFALLYWSTRFEQPEPVLTSPFEALLAFQRSARRDGAPHPAAFAIHAGDQIYFDVPFPRRTPSVEEYRRAYREAWCEDPHLRTFFAQCPHYMALDDHEIVDGFARDSLPPWLDAKAGGDRTPEDYLGPAERVYREYVHARHPDRDGALFYHFAYGATRFFVLDTRTTRYRHRGQLIAEHQLKELTNWLDEHREALKFVVSSVPFLAELTPEEAPEGDPKGAGERPHDKWCHDPYRQQRDEIIEYLYRNQIDRVVFLTGDMHCAYHASMRVGPPGARITLHELAGGPIHQLQFARRTDFVGHYRGATKPTGVSFTTSMRRIHGAGGNVLWIGADPARGRVRWEVVPTRTVLATRRGEGPAEPSAHLAAVKDPESRASRARLEPGEKVLAPMSGVILWDRMRCRRPLRRTTPS